MKRYEDNKLARNMMTIDQLINGRNLSKKNLRKNVHKHNAFTSGGIDTTAANFALKKDKPFLLAHFSLEGKTKEQSGLLSGTCYKTSASTQTMLRQRSKVAF
uniref:Uncharacterized protein n=1 Tax=Glossina pallidipes TaxID=7398 RepID=A0A1A9Z5J7_GLOPL